MSITVELEPNVAERVAAAAATHGLTPEDYVVSLIKTAVPPLPADSGTLEEFDRFLDEFSEGSESWPVLPPEANRREYIYADHD